ncbi:hypothetical protein [Halobellus sp. EA9]|uniref:DUF7856 family protein n=1 Tax=Halobellus sp. EA9 TaxID=3421647 RepID=UPI003EBBED30
MSGDGDPRDADETFQVLLADGSRFSGPVVDLRDRPERPPRRALVDAVRAGGPVPTDSPAIHAPAPGPAHAHVALLTAEAGIDRRSALAAVAAARGVETGHDGSLTAARRALRDAPSAPVEAAELREARRRAAEVGTETERLRERVATIRGRVTALRDAEATDATAEALAAAEASLSETMRRLSEVATERIAAEERLSLLTARARSVRDRRAARLRLQDRVGNEERAVRAARVAAVEDDFATARRRVIAGMDAGPGEDRTPTDEPEALADALAAARLAPVRAPVIVAPDVVARLGGAEATAALLAAPLVIC